MKPDPVKYVEALEGDVSVGCGLNQMSFYYRHKQWDDLWSRKTWVMAEQ